HHALSVPEDLDAARLLPHDPHRVVGLVPGRAIGPPGRRADAGLAVHFEDAVRVGVRGLPQMHVEEVRRVDSSEEQAEVAVTVVLHRAPEPDLVDALADLQVADPGDVERAPDGRLVLARRELREDAPRPVLLDPPGLRIGELESREGLLSRTEVLVEYERQPLLLRRRRRALLFVALRPGGSLRQDQEKNRRPNHRPSVRYFRLPPSHFRLPAYPPPLSPVDRRPYNCPECHRPPSWSSATRPSTSTWSSAGPAARAWGGPAPSPPSRSRTSEIRWSWRGASARTWGTSSSRSSVRVSRWSPSPPNPLSASRTSIPTP